MRFKTIFTAIAVSMIVQTVLATDWKALDGYSAYVDLDSKLRQGDISKIDVRVGSDQHTWEFDCRRWRLMDNYNTEIKPNTLGDEVAKIACKRKWEVWK